MAGLVPAIHDLFNRASKRSFGGRISEFAIQRGFDGLDYANLFFSQEASVDESPYLGIGLVLGWIAAIITFFASYLYCIAAYGFLFGLGLGWLPSGILSAVVFFAVMFLWGPLALLVAIAIYYLFFK